MTSKRICEHGHVYYKSSDCPTCPTCEKGKKPSEGFQSKLSAPARRALASKGIAKAEDLCRYTEKEILSLHGIGPSSLPVLRDELERNGLAFRK